MAQIDHPLFGKLKGKVGGLVYYTVNGITHIRSYPEKIKNPRSPLQEEQRNRLRDAMTLYKTIRHTPLEKIWQCATRQSNLTGANLFIKMNIAAFFGDGKVTDYGKLHFSCGRLPQGDRFQAHYLPEAECVDIRWKTNGRINSKRYDDRFMAVVMYEEDEFDVATPLGNVPCRRDGSACLPVPKGRSSPRYVYCFFAEPSGESYSNDICCIVKN